MCLKVRRLWYSEASASINLDRLLLFTTQVQTSRVEYCHICLSSLFEHYLPSILVISVLDLFLTSFQLGVCSQAGLVALASLLSKQLQVEEHLLQLLAALAMLVQVAHQKNFG